MISSRSSPPNLRRLGEVPLPASRILPRRLLAPAAVRHRPRLAIRYQISRLSTADSMAPAAGLVPGGV